MNEIND